MQSHVPDRLLTLAEVEQRTSISRASLYRLLADKQLASIKIRGSRRVAESDLAAFIDRMRQESA